jgi:predicted metal-dependent hydrolase
LFEIPNVSNHINNAMVWLDGLIKKDPSLIENYNVSVYKKSQEILVLGRDLLKMDITEVESDKASLKGSGNNLLITIPKDIDDFDKKIIVRKLLAKYIKTRYKKFVEERIKFWNEKYFQKEVKGVSIRDNNTNWGSCSYNKNINISTRSLLLPMEVFDYIIVHELSHLIEMNHSYRFWNVVEKVMPNYMEAEKWIKENGAKTTL